MQEIFTRRSVREFTEQPVTGEELEALLRAAMAAPSAKNQQPWQFIAVTDAALLEQLSNISPYSKCAAKAPLAIVVLGNTSGLASPHYCQQDLSAATQNILLEAVSLGLGGVWLGVYPLEERVENVRAVFDLPAHILPFAVLPLGHPAKELPKADRFQPEKVFYNGYHI